METVKNQLFQDHHILPVKYGKLLKISSSKTTTTTQRPPHLPKIETVKNQLFQDHILQIWKHLFFQDHQIHPK